MSPLGDGAGTALNPTLLACAGIATAVATLVSFCSIYFHLKNYRKPLLQRMVIRIMIMIPVYGIASYISLFSLQAAFFIDAIRDVYEAFVIYVFFQLLIGYLGGERSLLSLLHGRPPVHPLFPLNLFKRELDASDPYTYLWLKRGILQYVQVKPLLAAVTIFLKALGKYDEGDLKAGSGYLYVSIVYNISICIALYCLAMLWVVINDDLQPYRPMPKFLCVKGILFFSFWQAFCISVLVAAGLIKRLGPYTEATYISLGLTDLLICLEMPLFAIAHMYAFSHTDYMDNKVQYAARMQLRYAMRDAFGIKDVVLDTKATLHGEGMAYREFEPAEGKIHQGAGLERRIRAGLRYAQGGRQKYWLPMPDQETTVEAGVKRNGGAGVADRARNRITGDEEEAYAPLLEGQARSVVRDETVDIIEDEYSLTCSDPHSSEDELYEQSRSYLFGDYNYPCVDVSGENARRAMWEEEERILSNQRAAYFSPTRNPHAHLPGQKRGKGKAVRGEPSRSIGKARGNGGEDVQQGYGATGTTPSGLGLVSGDGEGIPPDFENRGNLIDFESRHIPDIVADGVELDFKKGKGPVKIARHGKSPIASSSSSPRNVNVERVRNSPTQSRSRSSSLRAKAEATSSSSPRYKVVAPDAVDLVVEDRDAEIERLQRERLRGEPAVRGQPGATRALRRVYRKEEDDDDDEEDMGNYADIEEQETDEPQAGEVRFVEESDEQVLSQMTEPPPGIVNHATSPYDEGNPWA